MKLKLPFFYIFIIVLAVTSCKKGSSPTPSKKTDTTANIYVSGYYTANNNKLVAVYLKNGIMTKLTDSSSASAAIGITVQGTDVYTTGYYAAKNGNYIAVYWKNKTMIKLADSSSNSTAFAIATTGNDVYVVGFTTSAKNILVATYWKNGIPTYLSDGTSNSEITAIDIVGNDVYLGGNIGNFAVYWKNDVYVEPINAQAAGYIPAIEVDNDNDVYAVGSGGIYWKNNNPTILSDNPSLYEYSSIALKGSDLYIAGGETTTNMLKIKAAYWKDNVINIFPNTTTPSFAEAIAVNGNDVYVVGYNDNKAICWKNGIASNYGITTASEFTGIVVVAH